MAPQVLTFPSRLERALGAPISPRPTPRHGALASSSWIESVGYLKAPDGVRYLAIFLHPEDHKDAPKALLYAGVHSWIKGLICAGFKSKSGKSRSAGAAYGRLVRGKYPEQTVTGADYWELRKVMGV